MSFKPQYRFSKRPVTKRPIQITVQPSTPESNQQQDLASLTVGHEISEDDTEKGQSGRSDVANTLVASVDHDNTDIAVTPKIFDTKLHTPGLGIPIGPDTSTPIPNRPKRTIYTNVSPVLRSDSRRLDEGAVSPVSRHAYRGPSASVLPIKNGATHNDVRSHFRKLDGHENIRGAEETNRVGRDTRDSTQSVIEVSATPHDVADDTTLLGSRKAASQAGSVCGERLTRSAQAAVEGISHELGHETTDNREESVGTDRHNWDYSSERNLRSTKRAAESGAKMDVKVMLKASSSMMTGSATAGSRGEDVTLVSRNTTRTVSPSRTLRSGKKANSNPSVVRKNENVPRKMPMTSTVELTRETVKSKTNTELGPDAERRSVFEVVDTLLSNMPHISPDEQCHETENVPPASITDNSDVSRMNKSQMSVRSNTTMSTRQIEVEEGGLSRSNRNRSVKNKEDGFYKQMSLNETLEKLAASDASVREPKQTTLTTVSRIQNKPTSRSRLTQMSDLDMTKSPKVSGQTDGDFTDQQRSSELDEVFASNAAADVDSVTNDRKTNARSVKAANRQSGFYKQLSLQEVIRAHSANQSNVARNKSTENQQNVSIKHSSQLKNLSRKSLQGSSSSNKSSTPQKRKRDEKISVAQSIVDKNVPNGKSTDDASVFSYVETPQMPARKRARTNRAPIERKIQRLASDGESPSDKVIYLYCPGGSKSRTSKSITDLDVILTDFEEIAFQYRDEQDESRHRKAISKLFTNLQSVLTGRISREIVEARTTKSLMDVCRNVRRKTSQLFDLRAQIRELQTSIHHQRLQSERRT